MSSSEPEVGPGSVTIKLPSSALQLNRVLEQAEANLRRLHAVAEPQLKVAEELERQIDRMMEPMQESARRFERILEQVQSQVREAERRLDRIVSDSLKSALASRDPFERIAHAPAADFARAVASIEADLRPVLRFALEARAGSTAVSDAGAASERILDKVARPPEAPSDDDGISWLTEQVIGAEVNLSAGDLLMALLAIVFGVSTCWQLETIEVRQRQIMKIQRQTVDQLDAISDKLRLDDDAHPPADESQKGRQ